MDTVVQLNVGGTPYSTTVATLSSHPGVLKDIVDGVVVCQRDKDGRIFIDSDGPIFAYVLNFLRHGSFAIPHSFDNYTALHQVVAHLLPSLGASQVPQAGHSSRSPLGSSSPLASRHGFASPSGRSVGYGDDGGFATPQHHLVHTPSPRRSASGGGGGPLSPPYATVGLQLLRVEHYLNSM